MTAAPRPVRRPAPLFLVTLALLVLAAFAPRARANGAFPDSYGILLPADRPDEIVLATTFGLVASEDAGKTWTWSCEQDVAANANFYQLGPAPLDRLFAISSNGLIYSDDGTCGWSMAGGSAKTSLVTDFFPDQHDPMHVLAIALPISTDLEAEGIYASTDGGVTFGAPMYKAPIMGGLTGIEIARSDPRVAYAAMYESPGIHPRILRSADGGASWGTPIDIEPQIGQSTYRIIAIDAEDPQKLYLRVQEPLQESLAISTDGGMTFSKPVTFPVRMTAFARLASGTILVGGLTADSQGLMAPSSFRSTDGGKTFAPWLTPSLRGLTERAGKLYAAADNTKDPFALGVSTDEGMTFQPLMKFSDVGGIKSCVQAMCAMSSSCTTLVKQHVFSASVCQAPPTPTASKGSGCSYQSGPDRAGLPGTLLLAVGIAIAARAGVRARRRRAISSTVALDRPPTAR